MVFSDDEREFAKRWLEKGVSKKKVLDAVWNRRHETGSTGDFMYGVASAVPTTILGAAKIAGKTGAALTTGREKSNWKDKAMKSVVRSNPMLSSFSLLSKMIGSDNFLHRSFEAFGKGADDRSKRIQLNAEKKGLDAEVGQIAGDIGIDYALTAAASAATAPVGGAGGVAYQAAKAEKHAKQISRLYKIAEKSPRLAGWLQKMKTAVPAGLIIGGIQDSGQQQSMGRGAAFNVAGMSLASLIGAKRAGRAIKGTGRVIREGLPALKKPIGSQVRLSADEKIDIALRKEKRMRKFLGIEDIEEKMADKDYSKWRSKAVSAAESVGDTTSFKEHGASWFKNNYHYLDSAGMVGRFLKKKILLAKQKELAVKAVYSKTMKGIEKAKLSLNNVSENRWYDLVTGRAKASTKEEQEAVGMANEFYEKLRLDLNKAGLKVKKRAFYAPTKMKDEYVRRLIKGKINEKMVRQVAEANAPTKGYPLTREKALDLIKAQQAKYAEKDARISAEYARSDNFKVPYEWREKDMYTLASTYLHDSAVRIGETIHLGKHREVVYAALAKIARQKITDPVKYAESNPAKIAAVVRQLFERKPESVFIKNLKAFQVLKLYLGQITQLADNVPTAMRNGMKETFFDSLRLIFKKDARAVADSAGATIDEFSSSRTGLDAQNRFVSRFLKVVGFSKMQQWTDRTAVLSAITRAGKLRKAFMDAPGDLIKRQRLAQFVGEESLDRFVKEGMTDEMKRIIGVRSMMDLRPLSILDAPLNFNEPGSKSLVTQFRKYVVQITNTVTRDIVRKAKNGDKRGAMQSAIALLVYGTLTGEIVKEGKRDALDAIMGTMHLAVHGEWRTPSHQKRAQTLIGRIAENLAASGGIGLLSEFFGILGGENYSGSSKLASLLGPTASDVEALLSAIGNAVFVIPGQISSGKKTFSSAAGKVTSDLLKPIPFARNIFNKVFREAGLKARKNEGFHYDGGHLIANAIDNLKKKIVGTTDAGAAAAVTGNVYSLHSKNAVVTGDGGAKLKEYINMGNGAWFNVAEVIDGDTIRFKDGSRLRFAGVNAPELEKDWLNRKGEAGAIEAKRFVEDAFPVGSKAYVAEDKASGGVDAFGRKLGYPFTEDGRDISKELYETGKARVFNDYPYDRKAEFNKVEPSSTKSFKFTLDRVPGARKTLKKIRTRAIKNKDKYLEVQKATGVPWELIAAIHQREGGGSFNTYLHNGQRLGKRTTITPRGILFKDGEWVKAAIDAINKNKRGEDFPKDASLQEMFDFAERFNGLGYRNMGKSSPYIWSGTDRYKKGKYVRDGVYNKNVVDKQLGIAAIMAAIHKHA